MVYAVPRARRRTSREPLRWTTLYKGAKPAMLEERTDLTPEIVKHFVRTGVTVMPFFRKTEINDADLDALALYLSSPATKSPGG